ncbi:hypothetical protein D3C80_519470 [compost metagenome]
MGLIRGIGKLAGNLFDMPTRNARNLLAPCGRIGFDFAVIVNRIFIIQTAIETVIRQHQIVNAGDLLLATVRKRKGFGRDFADQHGVLLHAAEMRIFVAAEIGERHVCHAIVGDQQRQRQLDFLSRRHRLKIPFPFFAPAEPNRTVRRNQPTGDIKGNGFPFRIILLAQPVGQVRCAQHSSGYQTAVFALVEHHQHRHVGVTPAVVEEIFTRIIEVELFENYMAHRHGQRAVGALFWCQPLVAKLRDFRKIGCYRDSFGAFVTHFGKEVGIRRARLRDVRTPGNDVAGVIPVGGFRYVSLLTPGHR